MSPEGSISVAKLRSGASLASQERLVHHQRGRLAHENHLAAGFDEGLKTFQAGARDHRRGGNHDGPVDLAAEVLEAAVLDGGHRAERLLVEVIPIHLVFEQLPAQLGGAAVGLLVAHPHAVGGMVQAHLRGRASDGHQIAAPGWRTTPAWAPAAGVADEARLAAGAARHRGRGSAARSLPAPVENPTGTCHRCPVRRPSSVQTLGLPNRCAAEEASLGKLLLTFQVPSGVWIAFGTSWLRLSIPGTST